MNLIKWLAIVAIVIALAFMGSKTFMSEKPQMADGDIVEMQTVAWLKAMVAGEWSKSYTFTSPGYRSGVSEVEHNTKMAARRVKWLGGEILGHECEEAACVVDIRLVFKVHAPLRGVTNFESFQLIQENWVKLDDKWWLVPSK